MATFSAYGTGILSAVTADTPTSPSTRTPSPPAACGTGALYACGTDIFADYTVNTFSAYGTGILSAVTADTPAFSFDKNTFSACGLRHGAFYACGTNISADYAVNTFSAYGTGILSAVAADTPAFSFDKDIFSACGTGIFSANGAGIFPATVDTPYFSGVTADNPFFSAAAIFNTISRDIHRLYRRYCGRRHLLRRCRRYGAPGRHFPRGQQRTASTG